MLADLLGAGCRLWLFPRPPAISPAAAHWNHGAACLGSNPWCSSAGGGRNPKGGRAPLREAAASTTPPHVGAARHHRGHQHLRGWFGTFDVGLRSVEESVFGLVWRSVGWWTRKFEGLFAKTSFWFFFRIRESSILRRMEQGAHTVNFIAGTLTCTRFILRNAKLHADG
jgi:hypothetical protein